MVCDDDSASFVSIRVIQACDPVCARKSDARFARSARPRGWRTPPELWARKEFAWKATNSQTWNESLSIDHYPLQFFTRGRRDSIGHRQAPMTASMLRLRFAAAVTFVTLVFLAGPALAETNADAPSGKPDA